MTAMKQDIHKTTANTIRGLAMDAVQKAKSGHPGMPMGMADVATVLWLRHLRYSLEDPSWFGRDRFVLSAGHGSMLLYALLHLAGYPVSLDDLARFRQLHSNTPGHPETNSGGLAKRRPSHRATGTDTALPTKRQRMLRPRL